MRKILYITTVSRTINAFLIPHIQMLRRQGHIVDCACSIDKPIDEALTNDGVKIYEIPFNRNPLHLGNLKAFNKIIKIQEENNYDIVHVHTPVASVYGRLLKIKFPNLKTIYTVHGFHFHKGAPILNWAIYYPIEKVMANFTDTIITMNSEDYERSRKFKVKKFYKVNGVGVDLSKYSLERYNKSEIRRNLNINDEDFVILMIAEINKNKNHKQMVDAIEILKNKGIENIKVICAGDGVMLEDIREYIIQKNLENNIFMLGFRNDVEKLIASCDIGILMSYREGLPRNIMELMAFNKPVIGTDIRGIRDIIEDGVNGYLVPVKDSKYTASKIEVLYNNKDILLEMSYNASRIIKDYSVDRVINQLKTFY